MVEYESEGVEDLDPAFVAAVLNALDKYQAKALNWGFFDLSISAADIEEVMSTALPDRFSRIWTSLCGRHGYDSQILASELAGAGLLYADPTRPGRYRTRFAEGVRLIARLRQTFRVQQWSTAPALVSDLKLRVAERRFPRRDQQRDASWERLRPHCKREALQNSAFEALASNASNSEPLEFAAFQQRAFARVLSAYGTPGLTGTIISAGTGAGKTKGFYVPAFLGVIDDIANDPRPFTKVIAVYPRNVLLADQLREALAEAAKLSPVLDQARCRNITFGALLGDAPPDGQSFESRGSSPSYIERFTEWKRRSDGWVIPYLRSPNRPDCELVWRDNDRRAGKTALYRADPSDPIEDIADGRLRITRTQIQATPPDVLFLSLEMLNQHMGNPAWARAFGLNAESPKPRLLLLDEVHTYEGMPGAQTAWTLRRWRHWGEVKDLHVVGLSATLKDGPSHLATVAGISASGVVECRPEAGEFEDEDVDMEYSLVLKGNPAAGTSLLATSIQTAMITPRLLNPRSAHHAKSPLSEMFFGQKVFAFSDKLDVVNRWLSNLTDAETNKRLPALRLPPDPQTTPADVVRAMERDGQVWRLPVELGHNLGRALAISRCSSQDPGANADSDLIVATSSLEVGFDDPHVGATLHHKRPRSMASFIQRKGRAGRRRRMRPWTVVVLSDYGADRWAFQNAEILLEPEVGSISVPLTNAHVLRIQSAYFLIDWIGRKVGSGSPFDYLRPSRSPAGEVKLSPLRARAAVLLNDLLLQREAWREFLRAFKSCFVITRSGARPELRESELDALLWEAPRSLVLEVVPELFRKLETHWRFADPDQPPDAREDAGARRPLPRHIPPATFAELDLSESRLTFPTVPNKRDESLSTSRALAEGAPGNVSKRYSLGIREPGYWHSFSAKLAGQQGVVPMDVRVADLFADRLFVDRIEGVSVYEPQVVTLVPITRSVSDTSKGEWVWQVRVRERGDGLPLPVLATAEWRSVFVDCVAFLHRDSCRLEVIRYSEECRYEIRDSKGNLRAGRLLINEENPDGGDGRAAIGFRKDVDGVVCQLRVEKFAELPLLSEALLGELRSAYFRDGLLESTALPDDVSRFVRDWLWRMSLSMLTATGARNGEPLKSAQARLGNVRGAAAQKVLDSIFQIRDVETPHGEEEARLRKRLASLWYDDAVVAEVVRLEARLWEPVDEAFSDWARRRYIATFAQALRAAVVSRLPEVNEDDLVVDVLYDGAGARVVVSETESGGVGVIERIVAELRRAPDAFHAALRHHLTWCPRAELADEFAGVVRRAVGTDRSGNELRAAFARTRNADSMIDAEVATHELRRAVDAAGFAPTRRTLIALITRLLQPGTPSTLDALIVDLSDARRRLASELEVWPLSEVFSYHVLNVPVLRERLAAILGHIGQQDPDEHQIYAVAQRLLVEGCHDSCPECLDQPNRYTDFGTPARNLAAAWFGTAPRSLLADREGEWRDSLHQALRETGIAVLLADESQMPQIVPEIQELLAEEIATGYLLVPISVTRVRRRGVKWEITFELRERGDA